VARALQADLEWTTDNVRAVTLDISTGGFAVLLAKAPQTDEEVKVQLRIPGSDQIAAQTKVVGVQVQATAARVAFAFLRIADADPENLEFLVFDTVLRQLVV
jgi:c-di-GMP-binding flagellar brake protein YcgR